MNFGRVRVSDWIVGAFGVALLVAMFCPWYHHIDGGVSGWGAFTILSIWLAILLALAIAVPFVTAARESPSLPVAFDVITTAVAIIALPFVLFRQFDQPGADVGLESSWGSVFGLICVLGIAISAWRAMRDQRSPGLKAPPAAQAMPAPRP